MKQWISLLLALVLSLALALPAGAAPPEQEEAAAWQLYYMGLFQGTDTDAEGFPVFSLDRSPTRAQGVTMLVRLLGQEEDAGGHMDHPLPGCPRLGRALCLCL